MMMQCGWKNLDITNRKKDKTLFAAHIYIYIYIIMQGNENKPDERFSRKKCPIHTLQACIITWRPWPTSHAPMTLSKLNLV